jgi:HK97 family phage prohead protease
VFDQDSVIAHEAGHVVGLLWRGVVPGEVRVDRPLYEMAGITSAHRDAEDLTLADVVATAMGPLAEGKAPPRWKPQRGTPASDEDVMAALVEYLDLTETDYNAALAVAAHLLGDPQIKATHALICSALATVPVLNERQLRELLGPHLDRFDIDPAPAREKRSTSMKHKQVAATVTETDQGVFTAIAAAYTTDRQGERIRPGAFSKTIAAWQDRGRRLPLHWNHSTDAGNIIGTVDPASMREVSDGLYVEGQLHLEDSSTAREAWRLLKHDAIGLSFGYMVNREHADGDGVTVLDELDLFEITLTPAPANPDTRVLSAKSAAWQAALVSSGSSTTTTTGNASVTFGAGGSEKQKIAAMGDDELRADLGLIDEKSSEPVRIATFEV